MERSEYERLAAIEEHGWWFRGLHKHLVMAWRNTADLSAPAVILDAGCGTGGLLTRLATALPGAQGIGLDLDALAASTARMKSGATVVVASIVAPPFSRQSFDAIFSADVLCHRGVEPEAALASLGACLKPRGVLVLNLPSYRWLFSGHDRAVDNVRRFGRGEVRRLLVASGFSHIRICHWNSLLFPIMVLRRLTRRSNASDVALLPAPVERLFRAILTFETWCSAHGLRLPFGGSILATAVKT